MIWTDIAKTWPTMDRALMTRWPSLTQGELSDVDGSRPALEVAIANAERVELDEARRQLAEWLNGPMPADVYADSRNADAAIRDSAQNIPAGEEPLDDDHAFGDDNPVETPIGRRD